MARTTINNINARISGLGYEIVRGTGYFYFMPLAGHSDHLMLNDSMVYTTRLGDSTVDQWVEELTTKMIDEGIEI